MRVISKPGRNEPQSLREGGPILKRDMHFMLGRIPRIRDSPPLLNPLRARIASRSHVTFERGIASAQSTAQVFPNERATVVPQLVNTDPLIFLALELVNVLLSVTARKDNLGARRKTPLRPRPIAKDSTRRNLGVQLLRPIQQLSKLRKGLANDQRPIALLQDCAL